ncbi:MAG: Ig domain-containing protein [Terrimicrobiaceae bacterium]
MNSPFPSLGILERSALRWTTWCFAFLCAVCSAQGADSICAKVRIEISQEVTLERQAFEARMTISNNLPNASISDVSAAIFFRDADGNPVSFTADPNNQEADKKFFVTVPMMPATIPSGSSSKLTWLILPTTGAGGTDPAGRLYFSGATLTYTALGRTEIVEVEPDFIFVKPQPNLRLDYFLPRETFGDDPLTASVVEPVEPYHLGLRLLNTGAGPAQSVAISSGQPRIVSDDQNLAVSFKITAAAVNDLPAPPQIQVPIGTILPSSAATVAWQMETSLYGHVASFDATYSHADELGGRATSLFSETHTHELLGIVRVDLPGRDNTRDFLAVSTDGNGVKTTGIFESDGLSTTIPALFATDLPMSGAGARRTLAATFTGAPEFACLKAPMPAGVGPAILRAVRSDGKVLPTGNAWVSKTRNPAEQYERFVNVFDTSVPAAVSYDIEFGAASNQAPVFAPLRNLVVHPDTPLSFAVRASDPDGPLPAVSASPLPAGASFVPGVGSGAFSWTPSPTQAGSYVLAFSASDGIAASSASMLVKVVDGTKSLLDEWKERWFGAETDPNIVANWADPDADGLSNLLEYALDLDPTTSSIESKPVIGRTQIDGKNYLTLTYVHRTEDPRLVLETVASSDVKLNEDQWVAQTVELSESQDDLPPGMRRTTFRDSTALEDAGYRFLRLRVSLEP